MRADIRKKFNEQAAIDFFFKTEGLPYGYHNFLYGFLDTKDDNLPPLMPKELIPVAFSMFEEMNPT